VQFSCVLTCVRREFLRAGHTINKKYLFSLLLICIAPVSHALEISTAKVALQDIVTEISVAGVTPASEVRLSVAGVSYSAVADDFGNASFPEVIVADSGTAEILVNDAAGGSASASLRVLPGWISITPPLLAILIALLLRNVIPALLVGVWFGATALRSFSGPGVFGGLLDGFEIYVVGALADRDHAAIILFSLMIGGMVGIITRNGGMARIVQLMVSRAKTAVSGQVAVWGMGLMIFFDDYSNTLVVGNTARPLTDHLKISREKLAYIVDSTAAPVVCLALITTWIGYEVGLIDESIRSIEGITEPAYTIFLQSIPYSFYPILAVIFVLSVAASGRDFGPMYTAEVRARNGQVSSSTADEMPAMNSDTLEPKDDIPLRAVNAFVPLLVLIISLMAGLYLTGEGVKRSPIS